jgi:hypothetical protein
MMQNDGSRRELRARHPLRCALALGAALASGCATGVDVTEGELAEICATPNTTCSGGQGASVGNVGGSSSGTGGSSSGGSFGANGGTGAGTANGGSVSTGGTGGSGGTGGTGGTVNGTSGSGGTGAVQPLAEGECLPMSDVVISYRVRAAGATSNEPSMVLSVQNTAGASFDLSALAIRYWFTADGGGNFIPSVDYATLTGQGDIKSSVTVTFGQEFGSNYAELTFATGVGTVDAAGVREVQLRFHADPYQDMDQTNDFSFLSSATAATPNRNITPYLNDAQVGGCVPAGT